MAYKVIMPKAGMAMETGKIVQWLKTVGEFVETGEPLLEIETDKVNMEVEAMNSGVLLKILAEAGEEIPVVQTIGYIGELGEEIPEEGVPQKAQQKTAGVEEEKHLALPSVKSALCADRIAATPAARRIAKEKGIDLAQIKPSGSRRQIKAADVTTMSAAVKATPLDRPLPPCYCNDIGQGLRLPYIVTVTYLLWVLEHGCKLVPVFPPGSYCPLCFVRAEGGLLCSPHTRG